jgi:hypothetical protein
MPLLQINIVPTVHSVDDAGASVTDTLLSISNTGEVTIGPQGNSGSGGGISGAAQVPAG